MHIYYFWNILRVFYPISMTFSPRTPRPKTVSEVPHVSFTQTEQLHQLVGDWFSFKVIFQGKEKAYEFTN